MRTSRSVLAVAALLGSALSAEAKPPSYPYGFASRGHTVVSNNR